MIGKLVHADPQGDIRHSLLAVAEDIVPERAGIAEALLIEAVAVFLHSCEKIRERFHEELVIHDGIPLVPLQPFVGVHIVFRNDDGLRIGLLDRFPEALPETVIEFRGMSHIRGDIQAPAIGIIGRRDPLASDLQYILAQFLRGLVAQLGKCEEAPPGLKRIVGRPFILFKPEIVHIGRFFRCEGSFFAAWQLFIDLLRVQPAVEGAAVVEYAVQNNADPVSVSLVHQLREQAVTGLQVGGICHSTEITGSLPVGAAADGEIFFPHGLKAPGRIRPQHFTRRSSRQRNPHLSAPGCCLCGIRAVPCIFCAVDAGAGAKEQFSLIVNDLPEMGIDMLIILRIVFMAGGREKNRIEINGFHPQFLKIIQSVDHSLQVPAVKFAVAVGSRGLIPVPDADGRLAHIAVFAGQHIIGGVPVAEAVNEDLVHHRALSPCRRMESRNDVPPVRRPEHISHPAAGVMDLSPVGIDLKNIAERCRCHLKLNFVIIETLIRFRLAHAQKSFLCHEKTGLRRLFFNTEPYGDLFIKIRLGRCDIILCRIAEKSAVAEAVPVIPVV